MFSRVIFGIFVFFCLTRSVYAVSVTVIEKPSTTSSDSFSLTVSVFGANTGKNYLRVDLFKEGSSNYFGETHNGSDWYGGSEGTSYFPIDIISSDATVSATFQARIGNPTLTEYPGPGGYKLRIRRYTSASSSSPSDPYDITIEVPLPTATATHTQTPTKTPTNIPVSTVTAIPTPTKIVTKTPTTTIISTNTPVSEVLRSTIEPTETPIIIASASAKKGMQPIIISLLFIGLGFGLLSGVFIWQKRNVILKT